MRLLSRLDVKPLGDRQHALGEAAKRSLIREEIAEKKSTPSIEIPDHTRNNMHEIRTSRNIVSVGPNTPLLKRLVKHPKTIDPQDFVMIDMPKIKPEKRPERELFSKTMRIRHEAHEERQVKKFRPMELYIKASCVDIPSVEIWIQKSSKKNRL